MFMRLLALLGVLSLSVVGTAHADKMPFWGAKAPVPFDTPSSKLNHGEYTWAPQLAPEGPIEVIVSLDEQRAYAYRNGILIGESTISSGKAGHATPTGVFTTKLKDVDHHSSLYNDASMPYTQRLTNDGVALHAGGIPGYPESHGCVHLPSEFARSLFAASPLGMTVVIADHKSEPADVDHPAFLSPITDKGKVEENRRLFANESFRWEPDKSPSGPVSMLLSRYDSRVIVIRNGIEIGRARIVVRDPQQPLGTHVLVVKTAANPADPNSRPTWTGVGVVGHMGDANVQPSVQAIQRIAMPDKFREAAAPLLVVGSTLMVTDAPVLEETTGKEMAVLSSNPED
jgi:L,D-transpeptidase-like protein